MDYPNELGSERLRISSISASDPEGSQINYSLVSGGDASLFSIHQTSGALSFNSAADFEAPTDGNSDNSYNITVRATDGAKTADQAYTINVSNVSEAPVATNQTLTDIAEDVAAASNNGSAVSALVSGFTDGDDISGGTQAKRGLASPLSLWITRTAHGNIPPMEAVTGVHWRGCLHLVLDY
ncbi:MAG: cadherin repeat domain-containing protein [Gammaproteobacteria bacterium]|nr:cadherin repeat domain-containing protein [Gammaproteobacteria bacterium]